MPKVVNGKTYVAEVAHDGCHGCAFYQPARCAALPGTETGCLADAREDNLSIIWVEEEKEA